MAGAVLELACGSGQLIVPVAGVGVPSTGLDSSSEMLAAARRRAFAAGARVDLIEGDMRDVDLGQLFSVIFVARNSLLTSASRTTSPRSSRRRGAIWSPTGWRVSVANKGRRAAHRPRAPRRADNKCSSRSGRSRATRTPAQYLRSSTLWMEHAGNRLETSAVAIDEIAGAASPRRRRCAIISDDISVRAPSSTGRVSAGTKRVTARLCGDSPPHTSLSFIR
jgi:SAM-dependent methyltransferase